MVGTVTRFRLLASSAQYRIAALLWQGFCNLLDQPRHASRESPHAIDRMLDSSAEFVLSAPAGSAVLLTSRPSLRVLQWQDAHRDFADWIGRPDVTAPLLNLKFPMPM
jgi:hypothetical protein